MLLALINNLKSDGDGSQSLEDLSDEDLMTKYADDGDVDAFEILVSRHEKPLLNFIIKSVGSTSRAEELLQEVFLRIVKSASRYKQTAKFTTWVYTIARNLCIDRARKKSGKTEMSLDRPIGDDPDGDTFVDQMADQDASSASVDHDRHTFRQRLRGALRDLPETQREVFVLREFSGLKYREISDVVDAPVPTIKSRMRYALKSLRGHLAAYKGHSFDAEERTELEAE